jgi:hypothetical protein
MEAELRAIVDAAVGAELGHEVNLAEAIRPRFALFGEVDDLVVLPQRPCAKSTDPRSVGL